MDGNTHTCSHQFVDTPTCSHHTHILLLNAASSLFKNTAGLCCLLLTLVYRCLLLARERC